MVAIHRTELPAVPPRRHQAVPQGHQVLHREVPGRASSVRAGPARPERRRAGARRRSTRSSCARSRRSSASTGSARSSSATRSSDVTRSPASRAQLSRRSRAGSTTSCTAWASRQPQGGAPAHPPPPRRGERKRVDIPCYRVAPGEEVRVAPSSREHGLGQAGPGERRRGQPLSWIAVDTRRQPAGCSSGRPATRSRSPRRNSSSSSSTRSDHDH